MAMGNSPWWTGLGVGGGKQTSLFLSKKTEKFSMCRICVPGLFISKIKHSKQCGNYSNLRTSVDKFSS